MTTLVVDTAALREVAQRLAEAGEGCRAVLATASPPELTHAVYSTTPMEASVISRVRQWSAQYSDAWLRFANHLDMCSQLLHGTANTFDVLEAGR